MKPAPFYLLPAILLLAMIACSNTDDPVIDEVLLDVVWQVDSLRTPEIEIVREPDSLLTINQSGDTTRYAMAYFGPFLETYITINFNAEMQISGTLLCEIYSGIYEIVGIGHTDLDLVTWTEIGCPIIGFPEQWLREAIEAIEVYQVDGTSLRMWDESNEYVMVLSVLK